MRLVPMKFKDYEWKHNPREISFECKKNINELKAPYLSAYIQNMGRQNMIIRGEGELVGSDCLEQFGKLFELFRQGGYGVLAIPKTEPIFAVFEEIKIIGDPKPDLLIYSFVFREVMTEKQVTRPDKYKTVHGENLWDVSYKFGIPIDKIVELNPDIKRPDEVHLGYEVRLC